MKKPTGTNGQKTDTDGTERKEWTQKSRLKGTKVETCRPINFLLEIPTFCSFERFFSVRPIHDVRFSSLHSPSVLSGLCSRNPIFVQHNTS